MATPFLIGRIGISAHSAFTAFFNPSRGDAVAALGETTGLDAVKKMRDRMLLNKTGRRILRQKPIIHTSTISIPHLRTLPRDTFGFHYAQFLDTNNITPDARSDVKYIGDVELGYVMLRYRQVHDFWHVLVQLPITIEAEIGLKWFEYFQTGLPMNALSALFGPLNLTANQRNELMDIYIPWAIHCANSSKWLMNVYYEDLFDMKLVDLQKELGVIPVPGSKSEN
jgi:ubiquinone biosynthesis protein COQ4